MKSSFVWIALLFLAPLAASSAAHADVFDEYPWTSFFTLSTGLFVPMPARSNYDYVGLVGTADLQSLRDGLNASGDGDLIPVEAAPGTGLGLVTVYFVNHMRGDFGKYHEEEIGISIAPSAGSQKLTIVIPDISVTSELARAGGREIWGYPKRMANIDYQAKPDGDISFGMSEDASLPRALQGTCHACMNVPTTLTRLDIDVVTPKAIQRTWNRAILESDLGVRPYNAANGDSFAVQNLSGSTARFLKKVGFVPTTWYVSLNTKAVLFLNQGK